MDTDELELTLEQLYLDQEFLRACSKLDESKVHTLMAQGCDTWFQDLETGKGPLHIIVEAAHELSKESEAIELLRHLLSNGAVWNQMSKVNETPGCTARRLFTTKSRIYETILQAGVTAELLLILLDNKTGHGDPSDRNTAFLSGKLEYTGPTCDSTTLLDHDNNAIMMTWESEIMHKSAKLIASTKPDSSVLNIGFGLGIIDTAIQEFKPRRHVIIEAHPDVLAFMRKQGWYDKPNVEILEGRWQDIVDDLANRETFDGIYYDPFEYFADMQEFFDPLVALLKPDGVFSFFHGLGADNQTFYDVYTRILEIELKDYGLQVTFEEIDIKTKDEEWKGAKRRYWALERYSLPTCTFMTT